MAVEQAPLVVHIIYALGTGGLENGLVNIINRTPSQRYRHAIVCLTEAGDFARRITVSGVEVFSLHKKPGNDLGAYWRLWRLLRRLRPAIVHSRNLAALEAQVASLPLLGVKRVHGEHGRDINDLDGSNWKFIWLRRAMGLFIGRFIAVSQDLARWLRDTVGLGENRVRQIYNGVDWEKFSPAKDQLDAPDWPAHLGWPAHAQVVGAVGRLAEVKNQLALVDAFAELLARDASWSEQARLVLVGDGPLRARREQRITERGIADKVWLAGDRDDVHLLLRGFSLFALPSLAEGISNTVLEAQASGLPVLASDTGGNPELVLDGDNGLLLPISDCSAWADAMARLLSDSEERTAMGVRARERVRQHFNWQNTVASYLAVYDELLGVGRQGEVAGT